MNQIGQQLYDGVPEVLSDVRHQGNFASLRQLQIPSPLKSIFAFVSDWVVIAFAVKIALIRIFPLGILSVVLIGSRQRGLSNLVHDGAHGNLFSRKRINDGAANWFAALAMFDTVTSYRTSHLNHHRYLGTDKDPDSQNHLRYGYDDSNPKSGTRIKVLLAILTSRRAFSDSNLGSFLSLKKTERLFIGLWWAIVTVLLGLFFGVRSASYFVGLWILSRATAYHVIRLFAEFLDHAGLPTGAILKFTRNLPHGGWLARLFHPHDDTFHLVHHLLPKVPHYHLRKVHSLLGVSPKYLGAHHCDSYFTGSHSAFKCWAGKCQEEVL